MSEKNKIKNAAEEALGKAKEAVGDVTDNQSLKNEGQVDQAKAEAKKVGENVKEAFKGDDRS